MNVQALSPATGPGSRAARHRLATLVALAVLLADVASKNWVLAALGPDPVDLGVVALTVVENDGLAFSAGAGLLGTGTVLALRLAALAAVVALALRFGGRSLRLALGFGLVVGGGLGNAWDLVFRDGAVVDFISTSPLSDALGSGFVADGIVLNLADIWILWGLALLYPLLRALGLAGQRRLRTFERRALGAG